MLIAGTQYSLIQSCLEIYLRGCHGDCQGCHNPELKAFDGQELTTAIYAEILAKIQAEPELVRRIWILGGEPLDSDHGELATLLADLDRDTSLEIWLWTRYEIGEIPKVILDHCHYVKTGPYLESRKTDNNIQVGIRLASSNQKLWRLK